MALPHSYHPSREELGVRDTQNLGSEYRMAEQVRQPGLGKSAAL